MKKSKLGKIKTDGQMEIRKFFIVLIGLIVILIGVYYFTRAFVTKDLNKDNSTDVTYQPGSISDTDIIVGNMLNRPYDEYYCIAFGRKDNLAPFYDTLITKYEKEKDSKKIYYIDIDEELNKKYKSDGKEVTKDFDKLDNLKLGDITLLKIKKGKVTKIITNVDDIKKELNIKPAE